MVAGSGALPQTAPRPAGVGLLPTIVGTIDRRVLLNYRCDPGELEGILPPGMRPRVIRGWALVGVCLIRFRQLRPRGVPAWLGLGSENAAWRISVEWQRDGRAETGVFVRRRVSDSLFTTLSGGRLFPGRHSRARFRCRESAATIDIAISQRGRSLLALEGRVGGAFASQVFASHAEASDFFRLDRIGYSPGIRVGVTEGLELCCHQWATAPLAVERAQVPDFERDFSSARLDHALIMHRISHEWHAVPRYACG